jgi:hypothetical protein
MGRWASIVGHPFLVVPAAILVATSKDDAASARGPILGVVGASMVAIAVQVAVRLRRGEITDVDVSKREHRPQLYALAIAAAVVSTTLLFVTHQSPTTVRGAALVGGLLVVGAVANVWLKVSLHTAFAVFAAGIAFHAGPGVAAVFAVLALVVACARVAYGRHTRSEVVAGAILGTAFALLLAVPLSGS